MVVATHGNTEQNVQCVAKMFLVIGSNVLQHYITYNTRK